MSCLRVVSSDDKKDFFHLYWGDSFWRSISKYLYVNVLNKTPQEVDFQVFVRLFNEIECTVAGRYALGLLSRRSYFKADLTSRLNDMGFCDQAISHAIDLCIRCGALSEEHRTRYLIEKALSRGKSKMWIAHALKNQGADPLVVNRYLRELATDPEKQISDLYDKKYGKKQSLTIADKKKVVQFFQRRGFHLEDIFKVIEKKR